MAGEEGADVLAITEHWKCKEELEAYRIKGYKLISGYCRTQGKHGGSAIYSKEKFKCTERTDYSLLSVSNIIECSAAQIYLENYKILICIYKPNTQPSADVDQFLEVLRTILEKCTVEKGKFILVGDFNLDILSDSTNVSEFKSLLENFNLDFTNFVPTRPASGSCLDNIITPLPGQTRVLEYHISDHCALKFVANSLYSNHINKRKIKRRIINDGTIANFVQKLTLINWDDIYTCTSDPNQLWNIFHERFSKTFEQCFPKVEVYLSSNEKNIKVTPDVEHLKDILDKLYIVSFARPEFKATYISIKK